MKLDGPKGMKVDGLLNIMKRALPVNNTSSFQLVLFQNYIRFMRAPERVDKLKLKSMSHVKFT